MKTPLITIAFLLVPVLYPFAQTASKINLYADVACYSYDQDQAFVEVYYGFPRSAVQLQQVNGEWSGSLMLCAVFSLGSESAEPISRVWRVPITLKDTVGASLHLMIGKVTFTLAPGRYRMMLTARDEANPGKTDSLGMPLEVRQFPIRSASFSDLELCSSIKNSAIDSTNIFYKNTMEVVPNPTLTFGESQSTLSYYSELYNADLDPHLITSYIVSPYGKTMLSRRQQRTGKLPSTVETGSKNVSRLPTGSYTLIVSYGDTNGTVKVSQSKRFFVYNPSVPPDTIRMSATAVSIAPAFMSLGEDELDNQFGMARYIATDGDRALWESLRGAEGKKKYLTKFWSDRDPDPSTPGNEYYDSYMRRVMVTMEKFRTAYRPGWRSDRGRVYILYGQPDNIERMSSESDSKPYEIWTYDAIQSGVEFIFADKGGFNDYELIHSTMRNEINNPDWQRQIQTR